MSLTVIPDHRDIACLRANIYFEARGETELGMQAVAKITLNRVKAARYPNTVCSVVFQSKQFSWTYQQSWSRIQSILNNDDTRLKYKDKISLQKADTIAHTAVQGNLSIPLLKGSLHYHADHVKPKWASAMKEATRIGRHVFYKGKS